MHLFEALQPSEYRPLVKGWDKTKYAELFNNQYRLYFPLASNIKVTVNPAVKQAVQLAGYNIDDYVAGIASKASDPTRKIKIGKLIKDPILLQSFANDPNRAASKEEHLVVISRHPYDIAGMSTDRGWTSCMNLNTGRFKNFVPLEIKAGTIVAYLIKKADVNIKNPLARMLIKPFINSVDKSVALGIENVMYGTGNLEFKKVVSQWVDAVNKSQKLDGIYEMPGNIYHDKSVRPKIYGPDKADLTLIKKNPQKFLKDNQNASEKMQLAAVREDGEAIEYIRNPSEAVQLAAVKENGYAIMYIKNPPEQLQLLAVTQDGHAVQFIKNPSDEIKMAAVNRNGYAIKHINNPSDELQIASVRDHGYAIEYIKNPCEEAQLVAMANFGGLLRFINNPSEEVQLTAVTQYGQAIQYIEHPSEAVKLAAVNDTGHAIEFIENPSEELKLIAVNQNGHAIHKIKSPSEELKLAAVKQDGLVIWHIRNPSEAVQLAAVTSNPEAFQYIKNPTEAVKAMAYKEKGILHRREK